MTRQSITIIEIQDESLLDKLLLDHADVDNVATLTGSAYSPLGRLVSIFKAWSRDNMACLACLIALFGWWMYGGEASQRWSLMNSLSLLLFANNISYLSVCMAAI